MEGKNIQSITMNAIMEMENLKAARGIGIISDKIFDTLSDKLHEESCKAMEEVILNYKKKQGNQ